jgi:hypothetical protein
MSVPTNHTYAEAVADRYKDQVVDIYLGDSNGNQFWAEYEVNITSFVRAKIIEANGDMLVVEARILTDVTEHVFEMAINGYNIKMLTPVEAHNPKFNITRLMLDNRSTLPATMIKGARQYP